MSNPVCDGLRAQGITVAPLVQDGVEVKLTWNPAEVGPILENRVLVALPDIHLSVDGPGDVFRQTDPFRLARLRLFLQALSHTRDFVLHQGRRFSVVHLGDFYDVWRAYPEYKDHPTADYARIETPYAEAIDLLVNNLDVRVCVGNHDASLALFPPWWGRNQFGPNGRLAYAHRFGKVLAFHGHQVDKVAELMQSQGGQGAVKAATLAAEKISNPLSLLIQRGIDLVQDAFADPDLLNEGLLTAGWPKSKTLADSKGFACTRWCDRVGGEHARAILEHLSWKQDLSILFVGHSHRAGITAVTLEPDHFVPMIDVGSWVWGRAQFAVAVEGEVSLWTLGAIPH